MTDGQTDGRTDRRTTDKLVPNWRFASQRHKKWFSHFVILFHRSAQKGGVIYRRLASKGVLQSHLSQDLFAELLYIECYRLLCRLGRRTPLSTSEIISFNHLVQFKQFPAVYKSERTKHALPITKQE